ncbi:hypothetical protein [Sorangium sp. So ce233]|uniref:hypothetical protein n=1 Tax=Sorangium sp. So ce233 TaxID=3133290 RepID=UPI003F6272BA
MPGIGKRGTPRNRKDYDLHIKLDERTRERLMALMDATGLGDTAAGIVRLGIDRLHEVVFGGKEGRQG